jgi:hypothetical protein
VFTIVFVVVPVYFTVQVCCNQGETDDLLSAELVGRFGALQGHSLDSLKEALAMIGEKLRELVGSTAEALCDDDSHCDQLELLAENSHAFGELIPLAMEKTLFKSMVTKGVAAARAFHKWISLKNKGNTSSFNKAIMNFKDLKLPVTAQSDDNKDLLRSFLKGLVKATAEHGTLQKEAAANAHAVLKATVQQLGKIANGARDASSWKEGLRGGEEASLRDVINHALTPKTGLLAGPGPRVMGAREELEKAFCLHACFALVPFWAQRLIHLVRHQQST